MPQDRERARKAYQAMKRLGVSAETVTPVLRRLFKLYGKKWELIEEDNYRTLADAIFENEEDKREADRKTEFFRGDTRTPSIKGDPEDQVSSTSRNSKKVLEPDDGATKMAESSQSVSVDTTGEVSRHASEAPSESKCMDLVMGEKKKSDITGSSQFAVPPLHTTHPAPGSRQHSGSRKKQMGSSPLFNNPQTTTQTTYDIASSACGQVKISLTCRHTVLQNNFQFPTPDGILSFARHFCHAQGPQFSLINLLNEFCESYLKAGLDPGKRPRLYEPLVAGAETERPGKRAAREISDITNGTEGVEISLLDETGRGRLPRYVYSPESITYESAYVNVSLARISDDDCCGGCSGDCLSSSIPCPCARETGGEFAYTPQGFLSEKFLSCAVAAKIPEAAQPLFYCQDCPLERAKNGDAPGECKGHRYRKFIKECWRKCGCNMECANRVVQRGITRKLQVFITEEGGKGWGLRALEELPQGAFVCEYAGEIITNMELYERNMKCTGGDKHVYPVLLDADWATEGALKDEEALCLDATHFGNVARFINHRCFDGNLIEVPVQVETPDRHYYHLAFFTKRKVDVLEELTWDYEIDFEDESHPVKAFKCLCRSKHCRDKRDDGKRIKKPSPFLIN